MAAVFRSAYSAALHCLLSLGRWWLKHPSGAAETTLILSLLLILSSRVCDAGNRNGCWHVLAHAYLLRTSPARLRRAGFGAYHAFHPLRQLPVPVRALQSHLPMRSAVAKTLPSAYHFLRCSLYAPLNSFSSQLFRGMRTLPSACSPVSGGLPVLYSGSAGGGGLAAFSCYWRPFCLVHALCSGRGPTASCSYLGTCGRRGCGNIWHTVLLCVRTTAPFRATVRSCPALNAHGAARKRRHYFPCAPVRSWRGQARTWLPPLARQPLARLPHGVTYRRGSGDCAAGCTAAYAVW